MATVIASHVAHSRLDPVAAARGSAAAPGCERFAISPVQFNFSTQSPDASVDELRLEVRGFLAQARKSELFRPVCSGWTVADPNFSRHCGERGFIGLTWPKAYGGRELSTIHRLAVCEEFLAAGAPVGAHWIADRQSGPQIIRHGSPILAQRVLPAVARGETYFCIGMSEAGAGSDLAAIRSRAHRVPGGWRLEGSKTWTTNAHIADYMIGLFRTSPWSAENRHADLTQLIVPMKAPGVRVTPIRSYADTHAFSEVHLAGVFVPDENVIGAPGEGWRLVTSELGLERSGPERFLSVFPLLDAACHSTGLERSRKAAAALGRLVAHIATLREMSLSVAQALNQGREVSTEAALVKDLGNTLEQEIPRILRHCGAELLLCGGRDFSELLLHATLEAPSYTIRGGTPQILHGIIARALGMR